MADGLDHPEDNPAQWMLRTIPPSCGGAPSRCREAIPGVRLRIPIGQPICGIGNRLPIHVCQVGSSRSTAALALSP